MAGDSSDRHSDLASAVRDVQAALARRDDAYPALTAARGVAERGARWAALAQRYEAAAEMSSSADETVLLLTEAGDLRRKIRADREAEECYRRVIGIRPSDVHAVECLAELYREQERWSELATLLEQRLDRMPRSGDPQRAETLRTLADLYADQLGRPREAAETFERIAAPTREDMVRHIELYERARMWRPAMSMLQKLAGGSSRSPEAREAMRRIAEIYEREIDLPSKAVAAYQALLRRFPDDDGALVAIEPLLERTGQWEALVEVLQRRAVRSQDPEEKSALNQRRAQIMIRHLDRAGNAIALLRRDQGGSGPPAITDDLVRLMEQSDHPREVVKLLEAQLEWHEANGSEPGRRVGILLKIAAQRAGALSDRGGARRALEAALELVPDHAGALGQLADLERDADPRAFADARVREAEALADDAARVEAFVDAARAYHERVGDADAARDALARAVAIAPGHGEATTRLAALHREAGDAAAAAEVLSAFIDTDPPAELRAEALTTLAELELGSDEAGSDADSERHLAAAIHARPGATRALMMLVDRYTAAGRFDEIVELLDSPDAALDQQPRELRAELERRCAGALVEMSRFDEAYERLRRADRLVRDDLGTRLALGDVCFRAGRWREAVVQLRRVAEHPAAAEHGPAAAAGLVQAAEAEIKLRRTAAAAELYRAALNLDPDCVPALREVRAAELARGRVADAVALLQREVELVADDERAELYEQLGDLTRDVLRDPETARDAYRDAVQSLPQVERQHRALLDKWLACEREIGDPSRMAEAYARLAGISQATERVGYLCDAASAHLDAGNEVRARLAAEAAVEQDPLDETAVDLASGICVAAEDWEEACSMLGSALHAWDRVDQGDSAPATRYVQLAPDELDRIARRATLWTRLGDARRGRGDTRGARAAYERAVETDGGPASVRARRGLAELLGGDAEQAETVHAHLVAAVAADPSVSGVLQLARIDPGVRRSEWDGVEIEVALADDPVEVDRRRVLLQLAAALGGSLSDEDRAFLSEHPARRLGPEQAYPGRVDPALRSELVADPDDEPMASVLGTLWKAGAILWRDAAGTLAELGLGDARRMAGRSGAAAARFGKAAGALDAPNTLLYTTDNEDAPPAAVVCAFPPIVALGPTLAERDDIPVLEQRFMFGRLVELVRPERLPAAGLPPDRFALLVEALARAFGAGAVDESLEQSAVDAEVARLRGALTVPLRSKLSKLLADVPGAKLDPQRYLAACERAADRSGMLVADDVGGALSLAQQRGDTQHLVRLLVDERYSKARAKLGLL